MDMAPQINENPDQAAQQPAAHNLIMRILKLRWMGMDDEAEARARCTAKSRAGGDRAARPGRYRLVYC